MILTEIFIVMCTLTSQCVNYADVTLGVLSVGGCERAIYDLARDHAASGSIIRRDRSFCRLNRMLPN